MPADPQTLEVTTPASSTFAARTPKLGFTQTLDCGAASASMTSSVSPILLLANTPTTPIPVDWRELYGYTDGEMAVVERDDAAYHDGGVVYRDILPALPVEFVLSGEIGQAISGALEFAVGIEFVLDGSMIGSAIVGSIEFCPEVRFELSFNMDFILEADIHFLSDRTEFVIDVYDSRLEMLLPGPQRHRNSIPSIAADIHYNATFYGPNPFNNNIIEEQAYFILSDQAVFTPIYGGLDMVVQVMFDLNGALSPIFGGKTEFYLHKTAKIFMSSMEMEILNYLNTRAEATSNIIEMCAETNVIESRTTVTQH